LKETAKVQRDFGWPPLVTPTSQIVGVQAVMNVVFGRYKRIPKETKDYIRGMYGKPPSEISEEIYKEILGPRWKEEVIDCRPADLLAPMYEKCRAELQEKGLSTREEDVISYAIYPLPTEKFLKGEAKPEFTSTDLPLETTLTGRRFKISVSGEEYDVAIRRATKKK